MKTEQGYVRKLRYGVQFIFLALTLHIGYRFYLFVSHFSAPGRPYVERPPSVDAFLPISGLMSLKFFLFTGIIEPLHPAAFFMFVAIVAVSFLMRKGFCGWICPIGTVSQLFWMTGRKIFGRNFTMEKYVDGIVRSLKYLLLAAFLLLIGVAMLPNMMVLFFITDYYKTADVRTMNVFAQMSSVTLCVLLALGVLSLLYKNFWCRYLCPYGALLGILSCAGPVRIQRTEEKCMHCRACSENCPSLLDVEKKESINSPECIGCMTCVSSCPSRGALNVALRAGRAKRTFKPYLFPILLVLILYLVIGIGMATGKWKSAIPYDEYRRIIPELTR